MGVFKDLIDWANGKDKMDKDGLMEASIQLNIVIKRLRRQERKLQKQADIAKRRVMKAREDGDTMNAKNMARNYLQVKKQVNMINNFQYKIQNLQFKLDQAKLMGDLGSVMKGVGDSLSYLKAYMNVPDMAEMFYQLDEGLTKVDISTEMISEGMEEVSVDSQVEDKEVDKFLSEVDEELGVEVAETLPQVNDDKIKSLEKELDELKSKE
jgi:charged multivesicular body protein 2A